VKKKLLILLGFFFVGLGVLGIFLPLLPTTPFLLLAAALFARSSTRFYQWLLNNRWLGTYIRNYREGKDIPLKAKVLSITLLWLVIFYSVFFVLKQWGFRFLLFFIACGVTVHLLTLKKRT